MLVSSVTSVSTTDFLYIYRAMIYFTMIDEEVQRLLDYHCRLYWLVDGWSMRFRVVEVEESNTRPQGLKYSFTLHGRW